MNVGQPTWSVTTATSSRPAGGEPQHRRDEVLPPAAEQPCGADDRVFARRREHRHLAGELRPPVRAERPGRIGFDVRSRRGAVEDVVGRDLHQLRAGGRGRTGQVAGAGTVHRERRRLVALRAVDVGPRGAVDDHLGRGVGHRRIDGALVGHVQLPM